MEYLVAGSATSTVRVGSCSVAGPGRRVNQDALLAGPTWFVVADGVGGHGAGDLASTLAVDLLAASPEPVSPDDLRRTIERVNTTIHDRARHGGPADTATTVVGVVIVGEQVLVFHLGDSRCYHVVDGTAVALTRDHSYVQELVEAGAISADAARADRRRNVITRALGIEARCRPEMSPIEPATERLLLCSDGVSSVLTPERIGRELTEIGDARDAAEALVRASVACGSRDDATALVIDGLGVR